MIRTELFKCQFDDWEISYCSLVYVQRYIESPEWCVAFMFSNLHIGVR